MSTIKLPSQDKLQSLYNYNPETGVVTRKTSAGGHHIGSPVGYLRPDGYYNVAIDRKHYKLHRVIWMLVYGQDPGPLDVDHINVNPSDNRLCNLRLDDRSLNKANHGGYSNNSSGFNGVSWCPSRSRWVATANDGKKTKFLGRFITIEEAVEARRAWDAR